MKNHVTRFAVCIAVCTLFIHPLFAENLPDISLPAPRTTGGKPLMTVLGERQSTRSFSEKKLSVQTLSDLLWAAFGINRKDSGKRTAPSTRNWQEVEIFVVLQEGVYRYDAKTTTLVAHKQGDFRALTGTQEFAHKAPLNLVYVVDTTKMTGASSTDISLYAAADVGFICQNVYLFCASEGLGTVVRGSVNREVLAKALALPGHKKIIFAQTVGFAGKP
ncbi:MAG: SagB/ThcOx family dehydrogenase [Desulfobacterales bacterium]|nr:SagB/ThcOx family dehydrogenase [Desulfobacterales bacterium]